MEGSGDRAVDRFVSAALSTVAESAAVHNNDTTSSVRIDSIGVRIELLNTNDNVRVSSSEISSGKLYYRFDGDRIGDANLSSSASTTQIIDDSSNTESLTGL